MTGNSHRNDIDGLRAVAVLAVVFYHAGWSAFSGGFVGVDVFFVISGFLIASILRRDEANGTLSLKNFWMRRIRRLFPALLVSLAIFIVAFTVVFQPTQLLDFGGSLRAQMMLVSNVYFARNSSYFDTTSEFRPLLHTWSLAVEEQFYLFFPLLIIAVSRWREGAEPVARLLLVLVLLSFAVSVAATPVRPEWSFFLLPTRAWEIGLGALLAYYRFDLEPAHPRRETFLTILGAVAVLAILVPIFTYDRNTPFPSWTAGVPTLGAAILLYTGSQGPNPVSRVLSLPPLVYIGRISYSLYLWHWLSLVFLRGISIGEPSPAMKGIAVLFSILAADLSYRFVETPPRTNPLLFTNRRLVTAFLMSTVVFASYGQFLKVTKGWQSRMGPDYRVPQRTARQGECFDDSSPKGLRTCALGQNDPEESFVLAGDSHALSVLPAIDSIAKELHLRGRFAATSGCLPFVGVHTARTPASQRRCQAVVAQMLDLVQSHQVRYVILVARWSYYTDRSPADGTFQPVFNDSLTVASVENSRLVFAEQFHTTAALLKKAGARVFILQQVPQQLLNSETAYYRARLFGVDRNRYAVAYDKHLDMQRFARSVLAGEPDFTLISTEDVLCAGKKVCQQFRDGQPLYYDNNHLGLEGSAMIGEIFRPVLAEIARSTSAHH